MCLLMNDDDGREQLEGRDDFANFAGARADAIGHLLVEAVTSNAMVVALARLLCLSSAVSSATALRLNRRPSAPTLSSPVNSQRT